MKLTIIRGLLTVLVVGGIVRSVSPTAASPAVSQPLQPTSGPGGSDYTSQAVTTTQFNIGLSSYILYEPANPSPATAPVVVFLQGYGSISPGSYVTWINHIVQKGNIVIYPVYLLNNDFTLNALHAVQTALTELQNGHHVTPDLTRFALVGHSCGSVVAANLAAIAAQNGLPTPSVLMPTSSGCNTRFEDYGQIPTTTRMVIMVPDRSSEGPTTSDFSTYLWSQTPQIPLENKDFLSFRSDRYGQPDLIAKHTTPVTGIDGSMTDALDYYGTWKIFDALLSCAWSGTYCDYALGGGPNQVGMSSWSDGTPVHAMVETQNP